MTDETKQIADMVRGVAAEKRATQERIAGILDLRRGAVSQRFSGKVPFTGPELLTLAIAMNVPITRFFPEPTQVERAA